MYPLHGEELKTLVAAPGHKLAEILLIREERVVRVARQKATQRDLNIKPRQIISKNQRRY
ncbi:MAG: hypothetical protein ACC654_02370 [Acidimicrobiia bacterium]